MHVHYHHVGVDAVFEKHEGGVVRRVHLRALVWLRRHNYLDERPAEERGNDTEQALAVRGTRRRGRGCEDGIESHVGGGAPRACTGGPSRWRLVVGSGRGSDAAVRQLFYIGGLALAACNGAKAPTGSEGVRVPVFSGWSIVVPQNSKHGERGTDWQASAEHWVVTVKLQEVTAPAGGGKPSVDDLVEQGNAWLATEAPGDRVIHDGSAARGQAIVRITQEGWQLEGYMAADGSVVVCVIDTDDAQFKDFATSVWRSLEKKGGGSGAAHKPPTD